MGETLKLGGQTIQPGQRKTIDLPVARLHTHTEMTMPVHVVSGRRPGPCLFVSAAIHGDEINGVAIVQRLLNLKLFRNLCGVLIAVPVVNVFGFIDRNRYLPDRRDLNRAFPGSERGSMAARLAHLFMTEVAVHATHGIDLHTGSNHRSNLPQIRAWLDDPETERLAHAFGVPVILNANLRDGSLRHAAVEAGIQMLLFEGGEALRFNEAVIEAGLRGTLSVMRAIGMLPAARNQTPGPETLVARESTWVRAPEGGILHTTFGLGDRVRRGQRIGLIADPFGEPEAEVIAHTSGIIIGRLNMPLVHEGEALFHLARFDSPATIDAALDAFVSDLDPDINDEL
jgi:hypothetical protein